MANPTYHDWTDESFDGKHVTIRNASGSDFEVVGETTGLLADGEVATVPFTPQIDMAMALDVLVESRKPASKK